jgi:hypothetical protein
LGFNDVSEKPSFFFTVPARNPRTLCCCQSVACIISSILAPSDWLSRVSTRSCLVTRSALGSSAFLSVLAAATRSAFDSTDRVGFLALAVLGQQRFGSPVVEYEKVDAAELTHRFGVTTVTTPQSQQGEQAKLQIRSDLRPTPWLRDLDFEP